MKWDWHQIVVWFDPLELLCNHSCWADHCGFDMGEKKSGLYYLLLLLLSSCFPLESHSLVWFGGVKEAYQGLGGKRNRGREIAVDKWIEEVWRTSFFCENQHSVVPSTKIDQVSRLGCMWVWGKKLWTVTWSGVVVAKRGGCKRNNNRKGSIILTSFLASFKFQSPYKSIYCWVRWGKMLWKGKG